MLLDPTLLDNHCSPKATRSYPIFDLLRMECAADVHTPRRERYVHIYPGMRGDQEELLGRMHLVHGDLACWLHRYACEATCNAGQDGGWEKKGELGASVFLPKAYIFKLLCVTQLCLSLCNPMDSNPPASSIRGILQANILEWVAIPFSRGSSPPRDQTWVSCIAGRFFAPCP